MSCAGEKVDATKECTLRRLKTFEDYTSTHGVFSSLKMIIGPFLILLCSREMLLFW